MGVFLMVSRHPSPHMTCHQRCGAAQFQFPVSVSCDRSLPKKWRCQRGGRRDQDKQEARRAEVPVTYPNRAETLCETVKDVILKGPVASFSNDMTARVASGNLPKQLRKPVSMTRQVDVCAYWICLPDQPGLILCVGFSCLPRFDWVHAALSHLFCSKLGTESRHETFCR
jgi:hypothetical protein